MPFRKVLSIGLLVASGLFSTFLCFKYTVADGHVRLGGLYPILNVFDFAANASNERFLTTVALGYVLSLAFLLLNLGRGDFNFWTLFTFSFVLTAAALAFEVSSLFEVLSGTFVGQHLRVGLLLAGLNFGVLSCRYGREALDASALHGSARF